MKAIIRRGDGLLSLYTNMTAIIIAIAMYAIGYLLCFSMLRIEQEADKEQYTKGDRVACIFISLLSFLAILVLLVIAWAGKIRQTGYWDRPVKKEDEEPLKEIE